MNREELIDSLSEDILSYVMHGNLDEEFISEKIKPVELDERFEEYRKLVNLHFILRGDVVSFVEDLKEELRSIKTKTKNVSRTNRGSIEGRINWSSTIKKRYSTNPKDSSLFICDNRSEYYDIDENIVLKKLLSIIHRTLEDCSTYLEKDYDWVNKDWKNKEKEGKTLIDEMKSIFERNVHVKRIKDPKQYEPTERMINSAENSRNGIYRRAADLIKARRRILNGEPKEIKRLLNNTAITPDDDETLFELYVLFRFMSVLENLKEREFTVKTIASGSQKVASMETEGKELVLYHDNAATDENLRFFYDYEKDPENKKGGPSRPDRIEKKTFEVLEEYFMEREFEEKHSKRPDVIVLEIRDESKQEYIVTEVKYSKKKETIERGISETLQYLAFMKDDGEFVYQGEGDKIFGEDHNGFLVIRDLEEETKKVEEQELIKIIQASKVEENLKGILKDKI